MTGQCKIRHLNRRSKVRSECFFTPSRRTSCERLGVNFFLGEEGENVCRLFDEIVTVASWPVTHPCHIASTRYGAPAYVSHLT